MALRIEDYALIGDCETAALVGRDGSIDWLCWPRFDSGACFAALLGTAQNGRWRIAPRDPKARVTRRYRARTLVLETDFETGTGAVTVIDFMPPRAHASHLVRLVVGRRGTVALDMELLIRFDYGSLVPWVTSGEGQALCAVSGPDMVVLRTPAELRGEERKTVAQLSVGSGETIPFVLTYGPSHRPLPAPIDGATALADTVSFWDGWAPPDREAEPWADAVTRSLVTLKALTYRPTGGIVAAPTTSLPERIGGPRNWDYRYCWLRDSTFTLLALMNCGYYEEARAWTAWLMRAAAGDPAQLQIMYGLAGEHRLTEWEVPWLDGYEASRPVRVGNAAAAQTQLDVYGEIMDALHHARAGRLAAHASGWELQKELLGHLESVWSDPDEGIWEVRGGARHFTYSKVMAWAAFDRGVTSIEEYRLEGPLERWRALRARIHAEVCARAFDPQLGAFVQSYGVKALDASVLLLPLVGFLPATDPRMRSTIEAIERELMCEGFVMRYDQGKSRDGLAGNEGAFLACTFWLADNLVLLGRNDDARRLFERLLALRNDVGLLAEEYDPQAQRLIGNFPQAFSHIAIINTAHNLSRGARPAEQRSRRSLRP